MHGNAWRLMDKMLAEIDGDELSVLDVGSLDVNGTYRPMVENRGWRYTGLDICEGPNVDIVAQPYDYHLSNGSFDVVISGSTMEHVPAIWRWVPELARVLRPGGHAALVTHWRYPLHRYPLDCWRILPDGMDYLLRDSGLRPVEIGMDEHGDIWALARKDR